MAIRKISLKLELTELRNFLFKFVASGRNNEEGKVTPETGSTRRGNQEYATRKRKQISEFT